MGFDLDRSEANTPANPDEGWPQTDLPEQSVFSRALSQNLLAEQFAIDAYRKIAEHGDSTTRPLCASSRWRWPLRKNTQGYYRR